ncbi:unnamed protein product [Eruca vesicaria subsp. sativa]|uniref:Uncharacterized protein n=1 Tax=Eruca vesicaria subsp. sativa TaxID=29727 RepID=A0ABC8KD52_ERUVS|nr:unnamed protein product [Eruca vesicaria subsp. sativa]CAH8373158.1 unnamed protein product [Eruca vesicaria subsp. sativa]
MASLCSALDALGFQSPTKASSVHDTRSITCSSSVRRSSSRVGMARRAKNHLRVVAMAPEEEKLTRRNPLDFPIEWERPKPGRRPDIFPKFSPMKTPLPPPMPYDPPAEDEEEEEEKKEEEEENPDQEEDEQPEKQQ